MRNDLVTVERFYTDHGGSLELNLVAGAAGLKRAIREPTVNRPGLVLSGFTRYFAKNRVQVIRTGSLPGFGNAATFLEVGLVIMEALQKLPR